MAQFLLPCQCGQKVRVEPGQAGGQVACACGQMLSVPTLRGLRQLEPAPLDDAARRRGAPRRWSRVQGALFSVGTLLAVVAVGILLYTLTQFVMLQRAGFTQDRTAEVNQEIRAQVESLTLMDTVAEFQEYRDKGPGEKHEPYWITAQKVVAQQRTLMLTCGALAAAGALAAVCAFFINPRRQAP